jgi:hypothetical protein
MVKIAPEPIDGQPLARPRGSSFERFADSFSNRIVQPALAQMSSPARNIKNASAMAFGPGICVGFLLNFMAIYMAMKYWEVDSRNQTKVAGVKRYVTGARGAEAATNALEGLFGGIYKKFFNSPYGDVAEGFGMWAKDVLNGAPPRSTPSGCNAQNLAEVESARRVQPVQSNQ